MKKLNLFIVIVVLLLVAGCFKVTKKEKQGMNNMHYFTKDTKVMDVINNKSFENFGKLIFPIDRTIDKNMTLKEAEDLYIWYNYINSDKTVEIVNYMKTQVDSGNPIFYSIYSEEEIKREPEKRNTGIFYFRGRKNAKFAILNAGGGLKISDSKKNINGSFIIEDKRIIYNAIEPFYEERDAFVYGSGYEFYTTMSMLDILKEELNRKRQYLIYMGEKLNGYRFEEQFDEVSKNELLEYAQNCEKGEYVLNKMRHY